MNDPERLQARPHPPTHPPAVSDDMPAQRPGLLKLSFGGQRESYLFVPESYNPERPAALVLLLHGAGGHADDGLRVLLHPAERAGLILVAPASAAATWDIIAQRRYGADLALADEALGYVFGRCAIDPDRLAVGGFSDGASYALSLGLNNGDLFSHVLAFSPGFAGPGTRRGRPGVYISHGTRDAVLPIDPCSRTIAGQLRAGGYPLRYREFDGAHAIPPEIAQEAVDWLMAGKPAEEG